MIISNILPQRRNLEPYVAVWWIRILAFGVISLLICGLWWLATGKLMTVASMFTSVAIASFAVEFLRRDGRPDLFGVTVTSETAYDLVHGFALTIANILFFGVVAYMLGGKISTTFVAPDDSALLIINTFLIAFSEELIFRGVIFQSLMDYFGEYIAVLLMALSFAFAHYFNAEMTAVSFVNLILAAVLFSVMYIKTQSLWLSISFHLAWNYSLQMFLGSPVSGFPPEFSLVDFSVTELPKVIFGGDYGIEGGVVASIALFADILIVLKCAHASPAVSARMFKRYYAESRILYENRNNK